MSSIVHSIKNKFKHRSHHQHGKENSSAQDAVHGDKKGAMLKPVVVMTLEEQPMVDVLLQCRAKMWAFNEGEWKERGVGNISIKYFPEWKQHRVVMIRDAVFKLCANFISMYRWVWKAEGTRARQRVSGQEWHMCKWL
jgi:RanBP1 domain